MKGFVKTSHPYKVPTLDNRVIEEHIGLAATGDTSLSLSHIKVPAEWSDCYQTPAFDEVVIVVKGRQLIRTEEEIIELKEGQSYLIKKGTRVQYSNPYAEGSEYWSLCIPAFTVETVNKEEDMFCL